MPANPTPLRFVAGERSGEVSALLSRPPTAEALLVLAHGAGAGMQHPFLEALTERLTARGLASFRYNFPFMEGRRRAPDPPAKLAACVRAAVAAAVEAAPGLPLFAGGKSLGGRMTAAAAADSGLPGVRGLFFLGFPLHAPGKPSSHRAEPLDAVKVPMLFLQGTRDRLAELSRIEAVCRALGRRADLHVVEGADHSFHVPKRSGRTDEQAQDELADAVAGFVKRHV